MKMFPESLSGVPHSLGMPQPKHPASRGKLPGTRQTIDGDEPIKGTRESWPLGTEGSAVEREAVLWPQIELFGPAFEPM
jgi:hypothetical protein